MDSQAPSAPAEKIIEIPIKKMGIALALILIIAVAGFFLLKNKGKETFSEKENAVLNQPPVAEFAQIKECYFYRPCWLDASKSYDPDGKITKYSWSINGDDRIHSDNSLGPFTFNRKIINVSLRVYDDAGEFAELNKTIEIVGTFEIKVLPAPTQEAKISEIKSLCEGQIKLTNYQKYYNDYINDFHTHLWPGADPYDYAIGQLVAANEFGVARMALSQYGAGVEGDRNFEREKDKTVLEIAKLCPNRFDAMLTAVYPDDPSSAKYVRDNIDSYKGISEIYIKNKMRGGAYTQEINNLANTSTMMEIYKILGEKQKPIHFHLDSNTTEDIEAIRQALAENPSTAFVWAHGCNGNGGLTSEFPNLFCEFEFAAPSSLLDINMDISRIVLGSDASVFSEQGSLVQNYQFVIEYTRFTLGTIPKQNADFQAHRNYEMLVKGS